MAPKAHSRTRRSFVIDVFARKIARRRARVAGKVFATTARMALGQGHSMTASEGRVLTFMKGSARAKRPATQPISVLIVDDEEPVRKFVERVLRDAGYATALAADGPDAIAVAAKMETLDILVTDVMMPEMQGDELARRLRQDGPNLKVLYLTGLQRPSVQREGHVVGGRSLPRQAVQREGPAPGGVAAAVRPVRAIRRAFVLKDAVSLSPSAVPTPAPLDEATYRFIFECNPQAMWLFDEDTLAFLDVNRAAIDIYGYSREEFLAMTETDIAPSARTHVTRTGDRIDVEVTSTRVTVDGRAMRLASVRDLSDDEPRAARPADGDRRPARRRRRARFQQPARGDHRPRRSAVGVLRARRSARRRGRRHPQRRGGGHEPDAAAAGLQPQAAARADGARSERRPRPGASILVRLIGDDIELVTDLEPSLQRVKADPCQVEQILLNLARQQSRGDAARRTAHAADPQRVGRRGGRAAVERHGRRLRRVERRRHRRRHRRQRAHAPVRAVLHHEGARARHRHGARDRLRHRQTERRPHRGRQPLWARARRSRFTCRRRSKRPSRSTTNAHTRANAASETVLLVEDDAAVRALIGEVLRRRGYRLLVAEGGARALELASTHGGPIDMLITDIVMPGMSGIALTDRIREDARRHPRAVRLRLRRRDGDAGRLHGGRGVPAQAVHAGRARAQSARGAGQSRSLTRTPPRVR